MTRTLRPMAASFTIFIIAFSIIWAVAAGQSVRVTPAEVNPEESDFYLYVAIAERMELGESYYEAAIKEQTERGYPVAPATTVRTPITSWLVTLLGPQLAYGLMLILMALVVVSAVVVFERIASSRFQWWGSLTFLTTGLALFGSSAIYFQETWAVLFMFLSICIRNKNLTIAIVFGLIACAFRELALPFVFAMSAYEFVSKHKKAGLAWASAGLGYVAMYMFHVHAVSEAIERFGDGKVVESSGWLALGGWPFIIGSVRSVSVLSALPLLVTAIFVPLALVGWLMVKQDIAVRFSYAILGFVVPFLVIGRPNNNYWALLYALLLIPGLAFSHQALKSLIKSALNLNQTESSVESHETP